MTDPHPQPATGGTPLAARCPRCGAGFECGVNTERCWCASLPPLRDPPADLGPHCLCPRCLAALSRATSP